MNHQNVVPDPEKGVVVAMILHEGTGEALTVENEAYSGQGAPLAKLTGGTMNPGETKQQAVIREASEETGIQEKDLRIYELPGQLPVSVLARSGKHYFHGFILLAVSFKDVHKTPQWDGDSLLRVDVHPSVDAVLQKPMVSQHRALLVTMLDMVK